MDKTIPIGFFLPNLLCLVTYTSGRKHCCELFFKLAQPLSGGGELPQIASGGPSSQATALPSACSATGGEVEAQRFMALPRAQS